MIISNKKTGLIVLIVCIVVAIFIIAFPYMNKYKNSLEKTSYCDGYSIKMKQIDPILTQKEVYNKCIQDYVKS